MHLKHTWNLVITYSNQQIENGAAVTADYVKPYRSGKSAFADFEYWKKQEWFNYPANQKVTRVQLIRDDGYCNG